MANDPGICDFGWNAPDFTLQGTDGRSHAIGDVRGSNGTVVMFICNHCPYVKSVLDRIIRDAHDLAGHGVASVAICSNDASAFPADSFDNMCKLAKAHNFPFPYLHDETQAVARAYDAQCTPDFFGFNANLELQYRGRLDASRMELIPNARRELYEAMLHIAETGMGPRDQSPTMGCSIKWKAA